MSKLYQNLFAGIFVAVGIAYETMALSMPLGGFGSPGPGLFPLIVGGALIITAAACLIQNLASAQPAVPGIDDATRAVDAKPDTRKAWLLVVTLIAYALALKPLGFPLALMLLMMASIRIFGYRNWPGNLAMSLLMTVMAYVAFVVWLKVPLPLGILAELLG